jgi:hypothetical protein
MKKAAGSSDFLALVRARAKKMLLVTRFDRRDCFTCLLAERRSYHFAVGFVT